MTFNCWTRFNENIKKIKQKLKYNEGDFETNMKLNNKLMLIE